MVTIFKVNNLIECLFLDTPAKAASQALQGLKQQLQQQHNEIQRQRQSQERASSEMGFHGNQHTVKFALNHFLA